MIYSLTGILTEKNTDSVVVDVHGIGFFVSVPLSVGARLPAVGEECTLYTYMSVKEDAMDLYGFADRASQQCFKTLIGVSGVGPKAGLAILSVLPADKVALAVSSGDYKAFTAASGVGPKVAQRIVLELKGKFKDISVRGFDGGADVSGASVSGTAAAVSALVALGYSQSQAVAAVSALDSSLDVQSMIKQALRLLAGGKI